MNRKWMQLAVAVAVALPAALAAQETPRPSPPRPPRARARAPFSVFSFSGNRGRIGVIVNTAANADSDKIGARIEGVTPRREGRAQGRRHHHEVQRDVARRRAG